MKAFWDMVESGNMSAAQVNELMNLGLNPHEIKTAFFSRAKSTPLSHLVQQDKFEEVEMILNHPHFRYDYGFEYFLRAVMDKQLENKDYVMAPIWLNDQLLKQFDLETIMMTNASVEEIGEHINPLINQWKLVHPGQEIQKTRQQKTIEYIQSILLLPSDAHIAPFQGIDYNEIVELNCDNLKVQSTILSTMIRQKRWEGATVVLINPGYQFVAGSVLALRAAIRMNQGQITQLLINALKKSDYRFTRADFNEQYEFFLENKIEMVGVMLNRLDFMPTQTELLESYKRVKKTLSLISESENTAVIKPLRHNIQYEKYVKDEVEIKLKAHDIQDNVCVPDAECKPGGRYAL